MAGDTGGGGAGTGDDLVLDDAVADLGSQWGRYEYVTGIGFAV
ncbi:hypothetical protein [Streptomyces kebangsaanensis]|uniref:Uncharacterized protein n=1 Tax=Streptomyces kebangsaanensis TaxID=864058 RepID=A0ABW6KVG4_9ACTN|nr:hypothetical protein [Streptomyces kebangsaanensis]